MYVWDMGYGGLKKPFLLKKAQGMRLILRFVNFIRIRVLFLLFAFTAFSLP